MNNKKTFKLEEVTMGSLIGVGAQGRIVAARSGDKLYAIKILSKKAILQSKQVDHIYSELLILHQTEHPNIVRFHGYCQNSTHLYYQMELIRGMNVFEYLQVKPFTLNHSLFYAVQIVNALDYLHQKLIIYRDIKPENIMINERGYIQLTDFGLSKITDSNGRTYTFCGTPEYIAPEVIEKKCHTKAVDFWGLGILLYEMIAQVPPFQCTDPYKMYQKIMNEEVRFPKVFDKYQQNFNQRNLKRLISLLLVKDQSVRLENFSGQIQNVLKDKVFARVPVAEIINQTYEAPMIPDVISDETYLKVDNRLKRQLTDEQINQEEDHFLNF